MPAGILMNRTLIRLGVIPVLLTTPLVSAGRVDVGSPTVEDRRVTFPVLLNGDIGAGVAALDFRFQYDPAVFKPVSASAGPEALEANKRIYWNVRRPGECSVVMMGMNQSLCRQGLVASIEFERVNTQQSGDFGFTILQPTLSSVDGESIAAQGGRQVVRLEAESGNEGEQDAEDNGETVEQQTEVGTAVSHSRNDSRSVTRGRDVGTGGIVEGATPRDYGERARAIDRRRLAIADEMRRMVPTPVDPDGEAREATAIDSAPSNKHKGTDAEVSQTLDGARSLVDKERRRSAVDAEEKRASARNGRGRLRDTQKVEEEEEFASERSHGATGRNDTSTDNGPRRSVNMPMLLGAAVLIVMLSMVLISLQKRS